MSNTNISESGTAIRVHHNSRTSLRLSAPRLKTTNERILALLRQSPGAATDRWIMKSLGFSDLNSVRPNITRLVQSGALVETGTAVCEVTGREVRTVDLGKPGRSTVYID
jgi:hypothetical protein